MVHLLGGLTKRATKPLCRYIGEVGMKPLSYTNAYLCAINVEVYCNIRSVYMNLIG
jgi:hypothetical protein